MRFIVKGSETDFEIKNSYRSEIFSIIFFAKLLNILSFYSIALSIYIFVEDSFEYKSIVILLFIFLGIISLIILMKSLLETFKDFGKKIIFDIKNKKFIEGESEYQFVSKEFEYNKVEKSLFLDINKKEFYSLGIDSGDNYIYFDLTSEAFFELKSKFDKNFTDWEFIDLSKQF